jgi:hypothetical protein
LRRAAYRLCPQLPFMELLAFFAEGRRQGGSGHVPEL